MKRVDGGVETGRGDKLQRPRPRREQSVELTGFQDRLDQVGEQGRGRRAWGTSPG